MAFPAQVARCGLRSYPLRDYFASAFHLVGQQHALKVHSYADACYRLVIYKPLPAEAIAHGQQSFASHFAYVQRHRIVGFRFAAVAGASPTSASTHFLFSSFAEINWQVAQVW
jgi:hypothetical protein